MSRETSITSRSRKPLSRKPVTVWFDGACPLCRREMALMRRLNSDNTLHFVDVSSEAERNAAPSPVARHELLRRLHVSEDGQIHSGAAAFAAVWRAVPRLRPFGRAAENRVVFAVLEVFYRGFLAVRPLLQRVAVQLERNR